MTATTRRQRLPGTVTAMNSVQATVATFDTETGSGTALLDSGSEIVIPTEAFVAGDLRFLRAGQRVRCELAAEGTVVRVTLITLP